MSYGHLSLKPGFPAKFKEEVAVATKAAFTLPFSLTTNSVVWVNGNLTEVGFAGEGTSTITFTPALNQFDKLTVKE